MNVTKARATALGQRWHALVRFEENQSQYELHHGRPIGASAIGWEIPNMSVKNVHNAMSPMLTDAVVIRRGSSSTALHRASPRTRNQPEGSDNWIVGLTSHDRIGDPAAVALSFLYRAGVP